MSNGIGRGEVWRGAGHYPWKLTVMYLSQEKTIAFPTKEQAESYLDFLYELRGIKPQYRQA